jgi:hypothetical protein
MKCIFIFIRKRQMDIFRIAFDTSKMENCCFVNEKATNRMLRIFPPCFFLKFLSNPFENRRNTSVIFQLSGVH